MSLFKSKRGRRNIRKKAVAEEEEEENKEAAAVASAAASAANGETQPKSLSAQRKTKEGRLVLSFGDELEEEEGAEFKVKKTGLSRRVAKMAERERKGRRKRDILEKDDDEMCGESDGSEVDDEGAGPQVSLSEKLREEGFIPSAEFIHRARREREERRQQGDGGGGAPSFLPLSSKKKVTVAAGKSRLVREDDNDKSDDSGGEEGGRRRMDAGLHDMAAVKQLQVLQGLEEVLSEEEDEETKRWEEQQIMKGVKASAPEQPPVVTFAPSQLLVIDQSFLAGTGLYMGTSYITPDTITPSHPHQAPQAPPTGGGVSETSLRIPEKLVPITVESLKSRLTNRLLDLQDRVSGHRERLGQIRTDLERSGEEIEGAGFQRGGLGLRYQFYQEMRGYLRDLLGCLGEKEPEMSGIEVAIGKVRRERADHLLQRRRQDIVDMDRECAQNDTGAVGEEVMMRQRRGVEREGRRRRRREKRERGETRETSEHKQGLSTDDELLEMNRLKFENNMSKALARGEAVFEEVVGEFSDLSHVKRRLEEWKFGFPESYSQAHIPLYLPRLFSPFARLQLLRWNPLEDDCEDFEDMGWYEVLMFYGFREGEELDPSDPDTQMLPEMIDRVIITKLTSLVQSVWDPLSSRQTRRLTSLLRQLTSDYPSVSSERSHTLSLFSAVLSRLRRATSEDVFIPLYTRSQVENSLSPQAIFYSQQFWSCVKLLGNITEWEGLVSPDALQELVLEGLLNKYLVLSLQTCPSSNLSVVKTGAIISRLPRAWLSDGATVTRPLQGLVVYLCQLSEQLLRSSVGHPDHLRHKTRLLVGEVAGQLVRLGAVTEANSLCQQHKLPLPTPSH